MSNDLSTLRNKAKNSDPDAQYTLSVAYQTILSDEEGSDALAHKWMSAAAENGHSMAETELPNMPEVNALVAE